MLASPALNIHCQCRLFKKAVLARIKPTTWHMRGKCSTTGTCPAPLIESSSCKKPSCFSECGRLFDVRLPSSVKAPARQGLIMRPWLVLNSSQPCRLYLQSAESTGFYTHVQIKFLFFSSSNTHRGPILSS